MSTLHNKIMDGLEKTARSSGFPLEVKIYDQDGSWIIQLKAGQAVIKTRLSSFIASPRIVLDPFLEEIISKNL